MIRRFIYVMKLNFLEYFLIQLDLKENIKKIKPIYIFFFYIYITDIDTGHW